MQYLLLGISEAPMIRKICTVDAIINSTTLLIKRLACRGKGITNIHRVQAPHTSPTAY